MYKSPVEIIYGQMQTQMEGDIIRAIQSYVINVDKEELIQAMQYDRHQYDKGYADGKRDAMAELVRCNDCGYWKHIEEGYGDCSHHRFHLEGHPDPTMNWNGFCSCAERKDNERKTD